MSYETQAKGLAGKQYRFQRVPQTNIGTHTHTHWDGETERHPVLVPGGLVSLPRAAEVRDGQSQINA